MGFRRETDEILFEGPVRFLLSFLRNIVKLNTTTPNVAGNEVFVAQGLNYTNFSGGAPGQRITIKGDGTSTIANNANIVTIAGANITLLNNRLYSFVYIDKWYQEG